MTCTRCGRTTPVAHIIDATLRAAAAAEGETLTAGSLCPWCLRALLPTAEARQPYLDRSA